MASRRVRERRRHHIGMIVARVLFVIIAATSIVLLASVALGFAYVQTALKDIPDANAQRVAEATRIYSSDNQLIARLYLENREVVPLNKMSPHLLHAVIAVEDERFYQHQGFDAIGIARALLKDIVAGRLEEGASTLTQQYVRNTLLKREARQTTATRKIREIYLAQELEKKYTKDQILAMYLNTVYFGDGAYGVEAAAKDTFGLSADKLSLAQAALLAGLPQSPKYLNPWEKDNWKRCLDRQHWVLAKMYEQRYITQKEYVAALKENIKLNKVQTTTEGVYDRAPYFVAYVKKILQDKYSPAVVFRGGLKVYTTLDTGIQTNAESAVNGVLGQAGDPSAALVGIDPRNGYIRAMVGGRDYTSSQFNLATQGRRQPGSSFKTFVLVTALEKGIPPYRAIDSGSPAVIHWKPDDWVASNSEGAGRGMISIESATKDSVNTVFARLIEEVGPHEVAMTAKRMGITTTIPDYPSIALGSKNVSPLEMASAYGTLAADGKHYEARAILKIVGPDGNAIYDEPPKAEQAISPQVSYATTKILGTVITGGTGRSANIDRPAAGKTGTSQGYRDAWFVGYVPQLVASVWVGYTPERAMDDVHGIRVFGGTFPAEIWNRFMTASLNGVSPDGFARQSDPDYRWEAGWQRPTPPKPKPPKVPPQPPAVVKPIPKPKPPVPNVPQPKPKPKPIPKPIPKPKP
jgi:1A family penicillin-binding protein